jgi:hypothetical protein
VLEALSNGAKHDDIVIVSIGTANTVRPVVYAHYECPKPVHKDYEFMCRFSDIDGYVGDLKRMATSILSDPPDAASFDAHRILNLPYDEGSTRFVRINPLIKPKLVNGSWNPPGNGWDVKRMKTLFTMDMAISSQEGVNILNDVCKDFFGGYFENQGIRLGGAAQEAILGHKTYQAAMDDWNKW